MHKAVPAGCGFFCHLIVMMLLMVAMLMLVEGGSRGSVLSSALDRVCSRPDECKVCVAKVIERRGARMETVIHHVTKTRIGDEGVKHHMRVLDIAL